MVARFLSVLHLDRYFGGRILLVGAKHYMAKRASVDIFQEPPPPEPARLQVLPLAASIITHEENMNEVNGRMCVRGIWYLITEDLFDRAGPNGNRLISTPILHFSNNPSWEKTMPLTRVNGETVEIQWPPPQDSDVRIHTRLLSAPLSAAEEEGIVAKDASTGWLLLQETVDGSLVKEIFARQKKRDDGEKESSASRRTADADAASGGGFVSSLFAMMTPDHSTAAAEEEDDDEDEDEEGDGGDSAE